MTTRRAAAFATILGAAALALILALMFVGDDSPPMTTPPGGPRTYGASSQPTIIKGTGLSGSASSANPLDLIKCSSNGNVPTWNGSIWTCATPTSGAVTTTDPLFGTTALSWTPTLGNLQGTGSAGNALRTNLVATACGAGSDVNSIAATGIGTCTAVIDSVAASAANGMTCSTAAGATSCWAGSATGCPVGDIEQDTGGGSAGWTCGTVVNSISTATGAGILESSPTGVVGLHLSGAGGDCATNQILEDTGAGGANNWNCVAMPSGGGGTITSITCGTGLSCTAANPIVASGTITENIAGASCTSGQAMTALGATGTGTCTALISGTNNTISKFSSATTLGNSAVTDDGTTLTFGATATTITESTGVSNWASTIIGAAGARAYTGAVYLENGSLNFFNATNGNAQGKINATGFNLGTTQFRDLLVQDGKGATVATFTGSTKDVTLASTATVTGALTASAAATVGTTLAVTGKTTHTGGTTTVGHAGYTGTAPAVSSCGASPTILAGSTDMGGQITLGAATTTTCTYTFNQTWAAKPFCVCSNASNVTSSEAMTGCDGSTTTLTITAVSGTTAGIFNYHCQGQSATIP